MSKDNLRPYRTDLNPNLFSALRAAQGFVYQEQLGPTIFWPGCSLASYSQKLTMAAYDFLHENSIVDGLSISCCSNILRYAANHSQRLGYADALAKQLGTQGVRRIVTACPNCYYSLRELLRHHGVEVVSLSDMLYEAGMRITPQMIAPAISVCVHDSCPDRHHGVLAASVRSLFSTEIELREKRHHGKHSQCCGLGKLQAVRHPAQSEQHRQAGLQEFSATDADLLVTYCVSCASAFQEPQAGILAKHYLELLFGIPIAWTDVIAQAEGCKTNPYDSPERAL
jgi:Fe-S oxidoreductase